MWYLVAQIDPDGKVTLGWTTEAYHDLGEALEELTWAHDARMTRYRIWELAESPLRPLRPTD